MKLTKEQIKQLEKLHKKADKTENLSQQLAGALAAFISENTGVVGNVDYLQGDGFGFTPLSNDNTHVSIDYIIKKAKEGVDITEQLILDHLAF